MSNEEWVIGKKKLVHKPCLILEVKMADIYNQKIAQSFARLPALQKKLVILFSLLLAVLISVFLIGKSFSSNFGQYQEYRADIIKLRELDAIFNQEVLKSRYELFASYDSLAASLQQKQEIEQKLVNIPNFVAGKERQDMERILRERKALLQQREDLSERFKSRNALLKNSLRYLPLLTNQLEAKFAAQERGENPDIQQISALRSTLNSLIRNLLLYNVAFEQKLADNIENLIKKLSQLDIQYELTAEEFPTQLVTSHAKIILDTKPQVEKLTNQLSRPLEKYTQDLEETLVSSYKRVSSNVILYRLANLIWLLLLLGIINYFLLNKLRRVDPKFARYKQEVRKITPMLTQISHSQNSSSTLDNTSALETITTRQDELGQLAQQVQQIVEKNQQEQAFTDEKLFASLHANLVLLTKKRRKLISAKSLDALQTIFGDALGEWNCQLIDFQGSSEQLQLLFSYPPQIKLSQLVAHLKIASSAYLYEQFQEAIGSIDNQSQIWSDFYSITSYESSSRREDEQKMLEQMSK